MNLRPIHQAVSAVALAAGLAASPVAWAMSGGPVALTGATCTNFSLTYANAILFDRNTVGDTPGHERYVFTAVDGGGNVLFTHESAPGVGMVFPPATDGPFALSPSPTANPITVSIVSPAGNGFPEQVFFRSSYTCADLPPAVVAPVPTLDVSALGLLSATVGGLGWAVHRRRRASP